MKKIVLLVVFTLVSLTKIYSQNKKVIAGNIQDDNEIPLIGASIVIDGTNEGAISNAEGDFQFSTDKTQGTLIITTIGFTTKKVKFHSSHSKYIEIVLESSSQGLDEVVVFSSRAVERKTPVAVSTIKKEAIELKLGNQEFVEILKSVPGVYASKEGGGFGDGDITLRGFNSENVAVLINGIPVNDMESGRVFWSNWTGLGSVSSSIQVQRGLGASKVAVPSIGGTINTITDNTASKEGGQVSYSVGNNNYQKVGVKLSTGIMDNGYAATVYADKISGDGYVDGTPFEGISYFGSISKRINEKHRLVLTATGATQTHGQRFERLSIQDYRTSDRGIKLNKGWGYKNGQLFALSQNSFNKPLISLNHYWKINSNNKLSTAVYYSSGKGGVSFEDGADKGKLTGPNAYRFGTFGPVDVDRVVAENIANGESTAIIQTSANNHIWAGAISTWTSRINDDYTFTGGLDYRYYKGTHFKQVNDLLGGQFYKDNGDVNNPNKAAVVGDKVGFYNDTFVNWIGNFAQLEYDHDQVTAFVAVNASNTTYSRLDHFRKLDSDPSRKTDNVNFIGFGAKTGGNYRLDDYSNIFANVGYFERAPYSSAVWASNNNDQTNKDAKNQKILSFELGYGLRLPKLAANLNVYRTQWNDRTQTDTRTALNPTTNALEVIYTNILGVNALHQGVELDFEYRPSTDLTLTGMVSLGDWKWKNDVKAVITDSDQNVISNVNLFIKDLPVGRSAQTTAALGMQYHVTPKTSLNIDYNYYDRYYADFNPGTRTTAGTDPWKVPSFHLIDASILHKFRILSLNTKVIARMNNVFNTEYITRANDNDGTAAGATVFFGSGRTFSISTIINF
ncbi:TonB-dependent receptor [Flavobacterium sp. 7A]|uniref:TonB-dependent receptor n=1 Tax=Flavobacterium sp. 7A TaxID=2940571 RepID=UPI0022262DAD|nr:carboxypeptidase-like regulatory domain-containing protein [Flavobacterium sp. 7A]MCW2119144.1 outer membrane receptor protein involved in Fe transport [Flavobacterium sp. 7A]